MDSLVGQVALIVEGVKAGRRLRLTGHQQHIAVAVVREPGDEQKGLSLNLLPPAVQHYFAGRKVEAARLFPYLRLLEECSPDGQLPLVVIGGQVALVKVRQALRVVNGAAKKDEQAEA